MTIPTLIENLQKYVDLQINEMAKANPVIGFMRPLISRATNNTISKADKMLLLLADKDGEVDVETILSEMINSVMTTQPFTINTSFLGDIVIGNGNIKVNIPYINKDLVLNTSDLQNLREILTIKG